MSKLNINITANSLEEAQAILGAQAPTRRPEEGPGMNDLLADLKEARFLLGQADKTLTSVADAAGWTAGNEIPLGEHVRRILGAALLRADDNAKTAGALGAQLDAIAETTGFDGPMGGLLDHIRLLVKPTAPLSGVDACLVKKDEATDRPASSPARKADQRYVVKKEDDGNGWGVYDGEEFVQGFALKREARAHADELNAGGEEAPQAEPPVFGPGDVVEVERDGRTAKASVVRHFEGTAKYEIQILEDGAGLATVDASEMVPSRLEEPAATPPPELKEEFAFADEPVSDGPNDDPIVTREQVLEMKRRYEVLGLSPEEAQAVMREACGVEASAELRVSQLRHLIDVALPARAEQLPF